jgi:hypothetical protein
MKVGAAVTYRTFMNEFVGSNPDYVNFLFRLIAISLFCIVQINGTLKLCIFHALYP